MIPAVNIMYIIKSFIIPKPSLIKLRILTLLISSRSPARVYTGKDF